LDRRDIGTKLRRALYDSAIVLLSKGHIRGRNAIVRRDDYGFTIAKVPKGEITIGPDSFLFPINVQQVFFADEEGDQDWKIVCRIDVHSRRSLLHFVVDESDVLNIGRDADFVGLNTDVVPGEVPLLETVFMLELSST
jgi:hypothetical protein